MDGQQPEEQRSVRSSIKGPLMFSAFWAVVAFFGVLIFASGGSAKMQRFDLAFTGAGIAFIVTLVISAMLSLTHKDNAPHLGEGSGVHLSSADHADEVGDSEKPGDEPGSRH
ncbi:hypothetical protein SAMN04489745_0522 [Arthrobacter woluwensis]|uniref:Uncharacterized protein n=2 Tax=Arthrobacter woluwensis TaxID=156980 RepID=A0A1H4K5Q2_9MICC|nr:hypothetical protein SAMN04489745_0522 [Arthrobacter woluwensis]